MPMPVSTRHSRCTPWLSLLLALGCSQDPTPTDAEAAAEEGEVPIDVAEPADGGEVVAISGPGGLTSPALAAGTFLGKGGRLQVGQVLETPRGTLAELRLAGGIRVRMNEDTALTLPATDAASRLVLTRGEIVVLTEPGATAELAVAAGDEVLTVAHGEAQIRNAGQQRHFAVIAGTASLQAPSRTLTLGPGESIDGPLPEERVRQPELSLAPLQETGWSHTFDAAARIADEVPAGVGSLTARRPGSNTERQRLRLTDQRVTVNIAGRIAHTEVEQAFFNDRPAVLEGIYRFPLPGDGSVSGLSLLVGDRWMQGEIVEKARARQIFAAIVDATIPRDPALLEWERGNLFKLRVFPIPGRGERRVRLAYTQVLPVAGETLRYRFPLAGSGAGGTEIEHFRFDVTIDGQALDQAELGSELGEIGTPMMVLDRKLEGSQIKLTAERDHFIPTADIGVDIPVTEQEARVHAVTHLDRDGQAYFMASLRPELELARPEGPTSFAFVLDRSHSTSPELWTVARGMVEALSTSLEPDDRFAVLACDTACDQAPGGMLSPQPGDLDEATRFLDDQDLAGASDVGGMLVAAAEALERGGAPGERVIVYLGDGTPSSGEMAADQLARNLAEPLRGTRVMAVALGARSDLTTLSAITEQTGGEVMRADARDDQRRLVRELRLRARVPVAHDIELDLPAGMVAVHRHGSAGLRPGDALVLLGKLSRPVHDDVIVRAQGPAGPIEARFAVDLEADRSSPSEHRHLPRTWAQAEIAHLTKTRGFDAKDEIVALSQHYTVMSRHTSLLVLENDAMYREFNVVRAAKNTDNWDGTITETEATEEAKPRTKTGSTASGPTTATPIDEATTSLESRLRGVEKKDAEKNEDRGNFDPAPPPSAADRDTSRSSGGEAGGVAGGVPGGIPGGVPGGVVGGAAKAPPRAEPSPEPEPFPGADLDEPFDRRRATESPTEEDEDAKLGDVDFGDDEEADGELGVVGSGRSGGGTSTSRSKPASRPAPKTSKPKKKRKPSADAFDDPLSFDGGGGGGGWSPPRHHWSPPPRQLKSRAVAGPDTRAMGKIAALQASVDADPTQRTAHGRLVRAALRAGHPQSLAFAQAWAEVDPDHAPALLSLADAMAADGDPMALRAYESVLEVAPFSEQRHADLARTFEREGDMRRACSHHRAVISIDPSDGDDHAELARCLEREGRHADALTAIDDGRRRATKDATALDRAATEIASGVVAPVSFDLHRSAQLELTLTWIGEDDLDLAVVDAKGRRLSGMRAEGKVRVRETASSESLTMKKVRKSVFIEVSRPTPSRVPEGERGVVRGELVVRTPSGRRTVPVSIREGTVRVAKVFWSR